MAHRHMSAARLMAPADMKTEPTIRNTESRPANRLKMQEIARGHAVGEHTGGGTSATDETITMSCLTRSRTLEQSAASAGAARFGLDGVEAVLHRGYWATFRR